MLYGLDTGIIILKFKPVYCEDIPIPQWFKIAWFLTS